MPPLAQRFGWPGMTRRRLLRSALLGVLTALPLAVGPAARPPGPVGPAVVLRFLDTARDSETTDQLIEAFREIQPAWQVRRDAPAADRVSAAFTVEQAAGLPRDLVFLPAADLSAPIARGWLRDLSRFPGAAALAGDAFPFVNEQTHRNGRAYAIPAWVRLHGFFYNRAYLTKIGQPAAPRTFDEIQVIARAIQRRHLGNYAFFWPIKNGLGFFRDEYIASGRPMFDSSLAPTFLADPLYRKIINWRLQAFWDWGIVDPRGLNSSDIDQSFPHGWASFTWDTFDSLKYWQTSGRYRAGGNLANGLCPSWTDRHASIAEVDSYAIPSSSSQAERAWGLARYLGGDGPGDFPAARQRWRSSGLVFSYRPLLADADLVDTAASWCDVSAFRAQLQQASAPPGLAAPGYVEWLSEARIQSSLLLREQIVPGEFIRRLRARWDALLSASRS